MHHIIRTLASLALLAALFAFPQIVRANCYVTSNPMPYLQQMNDMSVLSSLPIGETIPDSVRNYTLAGRCDAATNPAYIYPGAPIISCYYGSGTEVMPGVYSTGVSGIGIRLRNSAGEPMRDASGFNCDTRAARLGALKSDYTYNFSVSVEFVKTGANASGNLDPNQTKFGFGVYACGLPCGLGGSANYIGFSGSSTVRTITCSVAYPSSVAMATAKLADLAVTGARAQPTPFTISVTCDTVAAVGLTMDGAPGTPVISGTLGVLGITSDASAARGIGIQLVSAATSNPVPLRVRNAMGNVAASTGSSYDFLARYYSTGNSAAGNVVSQMIFTFDYR